MHNILFHWMNHKKNSVTHLSSEVDPILIYRAEKKRIFKMLLSDDSGYSDSSTWQFSRKSSHSAWAAYVHVRTDLRAG